MTTPLEQINISLRIIDSDTVEYTYIDPVTNLQVISTTCDLLLKQPSCCLFLLDADTSKAGWTITSILPNGTDPIGYHLGPLNLSVVTHCAERKPAPYRFYIVYFNTVSNLSYFIDPQELNAPPQ